jgi:hypothetical protein
MVAKQFFIAHGEKVVLSATLLVCAAQLAVTFTDSSIRPAKITPADIESKNTAIDAAFAQSKSPVMKPVPGYLSDMMARFSRVDPAPTVTSWLFAPPDRGPGTGGLLLYVLELPPPTITATDAVGNVQLAIELPAQARSEGKRITDQRSATWERSTDGVINRAEQLGVLIETHNGDGKFKPLSAKGIDNGFVPLAQLAEGKGGGHDSILIEGLDPWVRYSFRARLVAKATGLAFDGSSHAKSTHSVVVVPSRLVPLTDDVPWNDFTERVKANDPKTLDLLAKPAALKLPGITLDTDEQIYQGGNSNEAIVQVTADIRFALDKVTADLTDATKDVATFWVTKQFTTKAGDKVWLKQPQAFKAGVGQIIGSSVVIETPVSGGSKTTVNLTTPFKVVEIKRGIVRTLYWEIREKPRTGSKGKDLEPVVKTAQTESVVVENTKTKSRLTLTKLLSIKPPARAHAMIFPNFATEVDEEKDFREKPAEFVQTDGQPTEPKRHEPNEGPLTKLRAEHPDAADLYTTDTAYYEMPDGRLIWWEPLNRITRQFPEGNEAPNKPEVAPEAPAADGGKNAPKPPTGIPPGAIPPGAMPPGMVPPGTVPKPPAH